MAPYSFQLFTNDVGILLKSYHLLFADDLMVFRVVHDLTVDSETLQDDLNALSWWPVV